MHRGHEAERWRHLACHRARPRSRERKAEQTFVPRIQALPGFIRYQVAKVDDHTLLALGFFDTRGEAEELERTGAEWRKDVGQDAIFSVQVCLGEILLDAKPKAKAKEAQATV